MQVHTCVDHVYHDFMYELQNLFFAVVQKVVAFFYQLWSHSYMYKISIMSDMCVHIMWAACVQMYLLISNALDFATNT